MATEAKTTVKDIYDYDKHLLHMKLVTMVKRQATLQELREFITDYADRKLDPSQTTVNNYKNKIKESLEKDTPFEELLDKRKKTGNILDISANLVDNSDMVLAPRDSQVPTKQSSTGKKIVSVIEPLEEMIRLGMAGLDSVEALDPALLLKTIDTYSKVTGGANGGLTLSGLQQIVLQVKAKEAANAQVIMEYIPSELHAEVIEKMEQLEQKFYDDLDMTEHGRQTKKVLDQLGIAL